MYLPLFTILHAFGDKSLSHFYSACIIYWVQLVKRISCSKKIKEENNENLTHLQASSLFVWVCGWEWLWRTLSFHSWVHITHEGATQKSSREVTKLWMTSCATIWGEKGLILYSLHWVVEFHILLCRFVVLSQYFHVKK